ncbi:DUF6415 family natural product biosynthesis protein [Streptomyces sp. DSM 42041]|uniref:DUF6415 family natural product biosynthesis protein n=1 Tax=Streptomyces hazeniae TaxID=3075538 RepID=A0ABU2P0N0_9ACTN|nr:DUF6415 family natural product biosynthesis protein [Streptomyces sp. DSM 42041]MDT0381453.1 DUF6415 family natural product biosynthesis protein [Streptomyces sp. DSM 42041]
MTATKDPIRHNPTSPVDGLPVDVGTIRTTVDRALQQGPAPERDDLVLLEQLLRGHIQLLLPLGEQAVEQLDRRTVEYVGQRQALNIARYRVGKRLCYDRATAHTHVRLLAQDCRGLLRYATGGGQ